MSIDFSEEMEAPLITTGRTPMDPGKPCVITPVRKRPRAT